MLNLVRVVLIPEDLDFGDLISLCISRCIIGSDPIKINLDY